MSDERKMDRAREASAERDRMRRPDVYELGRALQRPPIPRPRRSKEPPKCPDCEDRTPTYRWLRWDGYRGLWAHEPCGYTVTEEELADGE